MEEFLNAIYEKKHAIEETVDKSDKNEESPTETVNKSIKTDIQLAVKSKRKSNPKVSIECQTEEESTVDSQTTELQTTESQTCENTNSVQSLSTQTCPKTFTPEVCAQVRRDIADSIRRAD